ncbi:hypothetical protein CC80DRAFT_388210, partial [Byssothecium circinans]
RRTSRCSTHSGSNSYRVEKPRSNHNSPMVAERRKTTTGAKLYASLDDHYRMMMGIADNDGEERFESSTTRPMSWHPSSTHFNAQPQTDQTLPEDWSRHYCSSSGNSSGSSDFYSLSARNSSYIEPVQNYSAYPSDQRGSQYSDSSYQTQPYNTLSSYSTPSSEPMPWYLQEWARKNQEQSRDAEHRSADFLPIQHPSAEQEKDEIMEDSGKELVGMGLYDAPDATAGWGSLIEATGKGLKLEETWQPPEPEEEDDDAEQNEEDDASSDDGEDELPPPPPAQQQPQQLHVPAMKPQVPVNLAGQSFFLDEDDSVAKEWWFHQLRQPSMPVRDAGIGHGWL